MTDICDKHETPTDRGGMDCPRCREERMRLVPGVDGTRGRYGLVPAPIRNGYMTPCGRHGVGQLSGSNTWHLFNPDTMTPNYDQWITGGGGYSTLRDAAESMHRMAADDAAAGY